MAEESLIHEDACAICEMGERLPTTLIKNIHWGLHQ